MKYCTNWHNVPELAQRAELDRHFGPEFGHVPVPNWTGTSDRNLDRHFESVIAADRNLDRHFESVIAGRLVWEALGA